MKKTKKLQSGQALVVLLIFVIISVVYTFTAILVLAVNSRLVTATQEGEAAKNLAESAAEDTLLNLLRDPNYTVTNLSLEDGNVDVEIIGDDIKTITTTATVGNFVRKVEVGTQLVDNVFTVTSWREVY